MKYHLPSAPSVMSCLRRVSVLPIMPQVSVTSKGSAAMFSPSMEMAYFTSVP